MDWLPPQLIEEAAVELARRRVAGLSVNHGYKFALLKPTVSGSIAFAPLRIPTYRYHTSADAVCLYANVHGRRREEHRSPNSLCECGFYSLVLRSHLGLNETRSRLPGEWTGAVVTLEVDLSGTVIAGEVGFRAEHIEVLSVTVPSHCKRCGQRALGLSSNRKQDFFWPSCQSKRCTKGQSWTIDWLRDQLGTEVGWEPAPSLWTRNEVA